VKSFPKINIALPLKAYRLLRAECERLSQERAYRVPYAAVVSHCLQTQLASRHPHLAPIAANPSARQLDNDGLPRLSTSA